MIIKIEIECETINEMRGHLAKLDDDILLLSNKKKLDSDDSDHLEKLLKVDKLDDGNCYGTHTVTYEDL